MESVWGMERKLVRMETGTMSHHFRVQARSPEGFIRTEEGAMERRINQEEY